MSMHSLFCSMSSCRVCHPEAHESLTSWHVRRTHAVLCDRNVCEICDMVYRRWLTEQKEEEAAPVTPAGNAKANAAWQAEPQLVTSEVFGVRAWVVDKHFRLRPMHTLTESFIWTPGVNEATCPHTTCSRSTDGCTCGFYAWTDHESARKEISKTSATTRVPTRVPRPDYDTTVQPVVAGAISALGEVMISTKGFRASQAKIVALVDPPRKVHEYYPDATIYPDVDMLLDAYDISPRNPKNDPDFWTKP